MNYCADCGYKLEGEFRFCPNCGSEIKNSNDSAASNRKIKEVLICKNCGEENSLENLNCFSCGVPLKGTKNTKKASEKFISKKNDPKKSNDEKNSRIDNRISQEKVLDNKKILIISSVVIIVFIVALLITGVFDSGVPVNITQMNNKSTGSDASLENLNEITDLENKIKANPDDMESILHLAHLQQDSKLLEKAISNYKKYLEKNPENADALVDMGICYYNLGDYKSAINEMESALKYQPKHQIACLNLGIVNLAAQNIAESKKWFKKTVELNPDSEAGKRAQELLTSH
jgi:tetratricopeptide (TPR) repeat protein/predicted RNA-binding Zn-ribbon protein involved in translation (DUF1610 family)